MSAMPNVRRAVLLPLLGLAALLGIASPSPAATHDTKHALWHEERFAAMMAAYRAALPGKLRVLSFELVAVRGELQVQDPAKPKHVDQYDYTHDQVSGRMPVRLYGSGKLEDSLFDWDEVAWDRIPGLVKLAIKKVHLEHGHVGGVSVKRGMSSTSSDVWIRVSLSGPRGGGDLTADAKGNVLKVTSD